MTQVWWIPGVGQVTTADNPGDLPPGAYLVGGTSVPAKPAPATTVTFTPTVVMPTQAPATPPASTPTVDPAKAARIKESQQDVGWDNIPAVRALQKEWWDIYIETGQTNTPRQLELNARAENIRKAENPMYTGRPGTGPLDSYDAAKIALPTDNFVTANGLEGAVNYAKTPQGASNVMGMALLGLMAIFGLSFLSKG